MVFHEFFKFLFQESNAEGSPRHSLGSNNSSNFSSPPSPAREHGSSSYESWIWNLAPNSKNLKKKIKQWQCNLTEKNEKNRLSFITIIIILNYNIFITNTIPWFPIYFLPKYLRTRFYYLEEKKKNRKKKYQNKNSRRS